MCPTIQVLLAVNHRFTINSPESEYRLSGNCVSITNPAAASTKHENASNDGKHTSASTNAMTTVENCHLHAHTRPSTTPASYQAFSSQNGAANSSQLLLLILISSSLAAAAPTSSLLARAERGQLLRRCRSLASQNGSSLPSKSYGSWAAHRRHLSCTALASAGSTSAKYSLCCLPQEAHVNRYW